MALTDRILGLAMLLVATIVFLYYTAWTIVMPFFDAQHALQAYFPERYWAIAIPAVAFIFVLAVTSLFIGCVMMQSGKKKSN